MKKNQIIQDLPYDSMTPIAVYKAIGGTGSCMLESAFEKNEGNSSFIGIGPIATFKSNGNHISIDLEGKKTSFEGDPYEELKRFGNGRRTFGFISYSAVRLKEAIPDRHQQDGFPDFFFRLYQTVIVFNHNKKTACCIHEGSRESLDIILEKCLKPINLQPFKNPKKLTINADISKADFAAMVEKAKSHIHAGDIFQVVLSRILSVEIKSTPFEIYRALRQVSPAPYHFFFEEEDFAIAGASPELMISVQDGVIASMPIAGTCPKDKKESALLGCAKESSEHTMLVDLARNDIGAIAKAGTVKVEDYMTVKDFSHVKHIVSHVSGVLEDTLHPLDAFKSSFPAGTLSGAPKIRAMEIIDDFESSRRGLYGGAIVTLDEKGDLMSCIAIRTAFIKGNKAEIRVGAGIVLDSDGGKEADETEHKAKSVIAALELAEGRAE